MINDEWDTVPLGSTVVVGCVDSSAVDVCVDSLAVDGCVDSSVVNGSEVEDS